METEIILGAILVASIAINVVLFRFAMWQSKDLANISDNLGDLVEIIMNYRKHLSDVYQLDSFYGDETLEGLMTHTNAVRTLLEEQYGSVINITDPIEYQIEEEETTDAEKENEKEKHVFYAGTRGRDS